MSVPTIVASDAAPGYAGVRRRFARVAAFAAVYSYLLVVFGGIVRITGSGLGCGDDWPLCNGRLIPPWDLPTWIEWTHRLLAGGLIIPIGIVALYAWKHRAGALGGRRGAAAPAFIAVALLAVQVGLGAITVKLDLPAGITAAHFVNALLLVAALIIAAVRAGDDVAAPQRDRVAVSVGAADAAADAPSAEFAAAAPAAPAAPDAAAGRRRLRIATAALLLGLVTVSMGALTANTGLEGAVTAPSRAAWACQGFPLCNGRLLPEGGAYVHIHWTHRLLAYLLFFHVIGAGIGVLRRGAPRRVKNGAAASMVLVVSQVLVAVGLIHSHLAAVTRVLHLIVGAALWMALVWWWAAARSAAAHA